MKIQEGRRTTRPHKYPLLLMEMDRKRVGRSEIAEAIGVSDATWTQMTRGATDPTISQAYKILKFLKLPPDLTKYFPEEGGI